MKVASFNVNSIRARLALVKQWLRGEAPDVLCLQETKVSNESFPEAEVREAGYHAVYSGEKGYNGVAILSRTPAEGVHLGFDSDREAATRLISARIDGVDIVNTYVPQGFRPTSEKFSMKLEWLSRLHQYFRERFDPGDRVIWVGDFNVAPAPEDVYDPEHLLGQVGFHPDEHAALELLRSWGFTDVFRLFNPAPGEYTFWDYRLRKAVEKNLGWRIDHIWATRPMAEAATGAWIDRGPRTGERPSDHTPVVAEFKYPEKP